ncbi:uncharacterized protein TRIADDRAFT_55208 [Trichoplax adhaerens]|uniref:Uncharacterized protein n=1 Tax=Trichoplax adhaerens TaxID=10228 RepID=B3RU99_TRIAD|nr:hypothetical protein TRIADDRAFT_55208 [Trichoplax adhaerens]EDV25296.1 hypothetical protein TRIADDRAFT_55208 [Trichoplax adhaerens]|eukprot:XP_002111329.1 hypothetical protein TRIADDRAFT_55208 [Trichoplax adhaerens]
MAPPICVVVAAAALDAVIEKHGSIEGYEEFQVGKEEEELKERARLHQVWLKKEEKFRNEFQSRQELIKRIQEEEKQRAAENNVSMETDYQEIDWLSCYLYHVLESNTSGSDADESNQDKTPFHNPFAASTNNQYVKGEETFVESKPCPFFNKTGVCRFGDRCSRLHVHPESSRVLLIPNMFTSIGLSEGLQDEQEFDTNLEYSENDLRSQFIEFYNDIYPEFQAAGEIREFKICCNYEPHLRGNVYVEYQSEEECHKAFRMFHGRWYAQRQLFCQFSPVNNWKSAICGLFRQKRCPKGKHCNFLHVFENPVAQSTRSAFNDRHRRHSFNNNRSVRDYGKIENRSSRSDRHRNHDDRVRRSDWHDRHNRRDRSRDNDNYRHEKRSKRSRSPTHDSDNHVDRKRRKKHKHRSRDSADKEESQRESIRSEKRDRKSHHKKKRSSNAVCTQSALVIFFTKLLTYDT